MKEIFKGSNVLVTGHTGFKGSWLTLWLLKMGANVSGISNGIPSNPSLYESLNLSGDINDISLDIRKADELKTAIESVQPDFIFHLAAQSLVRKSYEDPLLTWQTNTLGTANLLNSLINFNKPVVSVFITSDKCYDNVEWSWGYRETDRLGGPDPYSGSKGAAELVISSFYRSYFPSDGNIKIGIGRAGNVIGGGDWSQDRIVADSMRATYKGEKTLLRNPKATRPWQHVLEPLSGYLLLAKELKEGKDVHGEAFNFGPNYELNYSVEDLISQMSKSWKNITWESHKIKPDAVKESILLKLNCDNALHHLNWAPKLNFEEIALQTVNWYKNFYDKDINIKEFTLSQVSEYEEKLNY